GILVNPRILISKPSLLLVIVGLVVIGKFVVWALVVKLFAYSNTTALMVGIGLTQIGEFSYVLVRVARDAHIVGDDMYNAVLAAPNSDRERVFDAFRHWGYLEADLDPLGLFRPQPQAELQIENEYAREARHFYCGTIGVELMHITDGERRRWIQERMEAEPGSVDQQRVLELLVRADIFEQV